MEYEKLKNFPFSIFVILISLVAFISCVGVLPSRGYCPPSAYGETWLYHNDSGRCWPAGQQGPCGRMMSFYQNPDRSGIGICECDDILHPNDRNSLPEYCLWKRPKIYWEKHDRCYSSFDQGPCKDNEWLILDEYAKPKCEEHWCSRNESPDPEDIYYWFSHKGRCYHTFTYGYCPNRRFLVITNRSWKPVCSLKPNKQFKETSPTDPVLKFTCPTAEEYNVTNSNLISLECRAGRRVNHLEFHC